MASGVFEHGGDAIGGNDIEPHSRTDHDSGGLCLRVAALRGNEDVDLACDIEIVGSAYEAGVNNWRTHPAAAVAAASLPPDDTARQEGLEDCCQSSTSFLVQTDCSQRRDKGRAEAV